MKERWLPVIGFEGSYEVSDRGRVRSVDRYVNGVFFCGKLRVLKTQKKSQKRIAMGYREIGLSRHSVAQWHLVHRLVLEAFVGLAPAGTEAAHLDGDTQNNRTTNLAWKTHQANIDDRAKHGRTPRGERSGKAKLTDVKVRQIRARLAQGHCQLDIGADFGVSGVTISLIKRNKIWKHV